MGKQYLLFSIVVLVVTLFWSTPVVAGGLSVVINGRAVHVNSDYDWNEHNKGVGFEYEFENRSPWVRKALASGFRDSNNNMSYMAGMSISRRLVQREGLDHFYLDAGFVGFLMTREYNYDSTVQLGVLPAISVGTRQFGLNLTYMPKIAVRKMSLADKFDPRLSGIFFLQAKVNFDLVGLR